MPIIPIPDGLRRVARDSFDESEAERYRAEADAKLKTLQNTPMAQLGPDEPLKGDFKRPAWMGSRGYDTPDFTSSAEPTIVPAEGDQSRDLSELGRSPRFSEELSQPAAPESDVPGVGFGSGGPEGGALSEATILDIRKRLADKQASTSADKDMRSRLLQGVNPDEAASAIDLAAKSGVNRLQVEVNPETYKRADTMRQIDQLRNTAPKLRAWLDYNPENLDVAHDDTDNLSWWETAASMAWNTPGALYSGVVGAGESILGVGQMGVDTADEMARSPSPALAAILGNAKEAQRLAKRGNLPRDPKNGLGAVSEAIGGVRSGVRDYKLSVTPQGNSDIESGYYSGLSSMATQAPLIALAVATGQPALATLGMTATTAGEAYSRTTDENPEMPFADRAGYALRQAGIEFATELGPNAIIVDALTKGTVKDAITGFVRSRIAEHMGEQGATALQDLDDWLTLNPKGTWQQYIEARPSAALQTFVATLVGVEGQMMAGKAAAAGARKLDEAAQDKRTDQLSKTFDAMAQGAKDSKLLKRLPQKYRDAVAQVTKDGPLESVRVQPEAFNELAQSANVTTEQLAQAFRIDPADIVSAIESGEDVVIPSGNYAAALSTAKKEIGISGEQIHSAFAPNMRLRADDFTAKEREAMKAVFEEEQAARAESGTKEQGFADSADRVRETIREQVAGLKIFNTEAANTQAAIVGEMVTTLAERTGQDPETLWKEQGFDIIASLTAQETGVNELPQSFMREAAPVSDAEIVRASEDLQPREFDAWKMAREGKSNEEIAVLMDSEGVVTPSAVAAYLTSARAKGFDAPLAKEPSNPKGRPKTNETQRVIEMLAEGKSRDEIVSEVYPERDRQKALNLIRQLNHKHKGAIEAKRLELAQGERGTFSPRADRSIVRLFESSNLSTLVHEGAHWYLDTLWRMSQTENPHPFVLEQLAAILEWQGKSPNWTAMFDANGKFTKEGVDIQEAFAESFEAYLREGKAPTTALRSVFASFKAWLTRIYRSITQIGSRVRLNDEIRQVFDRMLATEDAIKAATTSQARDSAAMAQALLAKGIITEKAVERTTARLQAARERAEAEMMARLMEDYERSQKAWWRDEERQVRREVQSEVDERPEQRAYAWLSGKGWRDTREDHIDTALEEAEGMALLQRQLDLPTPEQRAAWVRENTVSDVIPGEASNSRQYGFKLSNGLGIVASLIPQVNGETEIHWTFLSRLMDRASEEDVYAKGDESLTGKEVLEMMPRILAIVETDMAKENRDAYTFTSARRSVRNMNARLVRLLEGFDYEIVEFPGQDDPILLHKDADIAGNGKIIPRPENAGRKFEWDRTEDPEAYADAFYAKVSDLRPGRPAGRSDSGERDRGDASRGELADAVRYVDLNATTESLRAMQQRMVADNVVPAILLFRADDGRVIAVGGEDVNFSHDQARDMLGLGDIHLAHGVYNPRKWPTLEAMDEAGLYAWYATSGKDSDGSGLSLSQARQRPESRQKVWDFLSENPDNARLPLRRIAMLSGIDTTRDENIRLVDSVRSEWRRANDGSGESLAQSSLPMDEASRNKRAIDQGFTIDAYHGTSEDISEFAVPPPFRAGMRKDNAVFFSADPDIASSYATWKDRRASPQWAEAQKEGRDWIPGVSGRLQDEVDAAPYMHGANVMPVKLRLRNPLVFDAKGRMWASAWPDAMVAAKRGGNDGVVMKNVDDWGDNNMGREARSRWEKLRGREHGLRTVYAVFDPENIRGKFAAFDPSQSGSSKLLAQSGADTKGRTAPPPNLPPMRLDLQAVKDQYGEEALANLPPEVAAYSARATDADQFLEVARDVRKTLKQKKPKTLWKFLSTSRVIGSGNDKISYRGIRDDGGEILKIIGEKKAAPGLISDKEDAKKVRSYTVEHAANVAWEEGYFNGPNPPTPAEFLDALRLDFDGQAPLYARADIETVQQIKAAEQWEQWFDANGIDISESAETLKPKLETLLTGQQEGAIGPDEAAPFFKMPDGNALLQGLKEGPKRNELIRKETQRRMIERHGDPFKDGTIMREAETFARNEVQQRQLEIELEALAKATGQFAASNLAKQQAQENLRSKQVREVLNYNQWLILEQRWGKKALEAAEKGKFEDAARYKKFQLLNLHMFREGRKLAEKIETTRKTLVAYGTKPRQQRLFAAGKEYAENMNSLLDDYQLRNETKAGENKRVQRAAWIKAQMAAIDPFAAYQDTTKSAQEQQVEAAEAIERSRALANEQPTDARGYKSLTVEEFMAVDAEATMIWKMATLADQLLKEGKRRRLTLAAEDIAAEIITNQPKEKPPEPIESDAPGEKVKRNVLKYFAMHRTMQSLAHQFAGGKDGGQFWSYFVKPLNAAYAHLSTLRKQMGEDLTKLFGAYSKQEIARFYKDRQTFNLSSGPVALTTQGRLAVALNVGNEKNRQRLMDSMGWTLADIQQIADTLQKRDWDFIQKTWDYLNTWFPEANRVHEAVHGAPMDKVEPMQVATKFGIYAGGYYPIAFDPELSSKSAQRQTEADAKKVSGRVDARNQPGFGKKRVEGKVTLPLKLSVFDVITRHLDQVATSIATEEALFDAGRLIRRPEVEDAIVKHHGRQIYNTIVNTLVTTKFGMEGTSGILAHLRNGATVVGLGWKVSTALLQPLGVSNSVVRVGGYWVAKGYARMGRDAATIQSSAKWVMDRSEFMRNRRQAQSPELAALKDSIKKGGLTPRWLTQSMFALMSNTQFYSVDLPTWYAGWYKAKAAGLDDAEAAAQGDQAVIDAQGGGELHQTAAIQTGAGTKYAAALRLLTNFMSYMVTTYNLATQRARNADTVAKMAALAFDMVILLAIPVAGKMALDAWTKGGGDDDDELWEKYGREQAAFLMSPFVGISQVAGSMRGDDAFSYRGPAGLGIFAEATNAGKAAAELDFDQSFWRPANKVAGMMLHYPASQADLTFRGALALWNGETDNPAALFFGPAPAN